MKDMIEHQVEQASTTNGLPVSPSMGPTIEAADVEYTPALVDNRLLIICALSIAIATTAAAVAQVFVRLINVVTNLSFFGRL